MKRRTNIVEWRTASGNPVTVGDVTVTPQSQALMVRWPLGGLVWNRPIAILVEREGQTQRIPIVDVARVVQLGLLSFILAFGIVAFRRTIRSRRK
jgi:hypothetical protein